MQQQRALAARAGSLRWGGWQRLQALQSTATPAACGTRACDAAPSCVEEDLAAPGSQGLQTGGKRISRNQPRPCCRQPSPARDTRGPERTRPGSPAAALRRPACRSSPASSWSASPRPTGASWRGVHPDGVVRASTQQRKAPWALDRIDQTALPLDGVYSYYNDGSGVHAYIVDTVRPPPPRGGPTPPGSGCWLPAWLRVPDTFSDPSLGPRRSGGVRPGVLQPCHAPSAAASAGLWPLYRPGAHHACMAAHEAAVGAARRHPARQGPPPGRRAGDTAACGDST